MKIKVLFLLIICLSSCSNKIPDNQQIYQDVNEKVIPKLDITQDYNVELYGFVSVPIDREDESNVECIVKIIPSDKREIEIVMEYSKKEQKWEFVDWKKR